MLACIKIWALVGPTNPSVLNKPGNIDLAGANGNLCLIWYIRK